MADTRFQTQVRNQSRAEIDQGLRAYMVKVYNYMAAGLGITAVAAVLTRRDRAKGRELEYRLKGTVSIDLPLMRSLEFDQVGSFRF